MSAAKQRFVLLTVLWALASAASAQLNEPRQPVTNKDLLAPWSPMETVLYTGASIHTVSGETLAPGFLLTRGAKIVAVSKTAPALKADHTVDLKGQHLFPGLILPTSSLGLTEISAVRATQDTTETEIGRAHV